MAIKQTDEQLKSLIEGGADTSKLSDDQRNRARDMGLLDDPETKESPQLNTMVSGRRQSPEEPKDGAPRQGSLMSDPARRVGTEFQGDVPEGLSEEQAEAFRGVQEAFSIKDTGTRVDGGKARGASGAETPPLPEPTAPGVREEFVGGLQKRLEQRKKEIEDRIKSERERLSEERSEIEGNIAEIEGKEETALGEVKELTQPFREDLEKKERKRLRVEENFFKNQQLVNEMDTLLTQLQDQVQAAQQVTGLSSVREPRVRKIKEDITARVGVIESVMAARNDQISVALNFIDRTKEAVTADRRDQLDYYRTLLNYFEKEKDDEREDLLDVKAEDKAFLEKEINILENDLERAEQTSDMIKEMMLDPETATTLGEAGVKLNDTPEQINEKISQYSYSQEVKEFNNEMELDGFQKLTTQQEIERKPESEIVRLTDSRGNTHVYWKEGGAEDVDDQEITRPEQVTEEMANELGIATWKETVNEVVSRMPISDELSDKQEEDLREAYMEEVRNAQNVDSKVPVSSPELTESWNDFVSTSQSPTLRGWVEQNKDNFSASEIKSFLESNREDILEGGPNLSTIRNIVDDVYESESDDDTTTSEEESTFVEGAN